MKKTIIALALLGFTGAAGAAIHHHNDPCKRFRAECAEAAQAGMMGAAMYCMMTRAYAAKKPNKREKICQLGIENMPTE